MPFMGSREMDMVGAALEVFMDVFIERLEAFTGKTSTEFPQGLEIMENLENHQKKFHALKSHRIWKKPEQLRKSCNFVKVSVS